MTEGLDLVGLVRRCRVIVCCGSGGVGKTTSAAAIGVLAAEQGINALVMTIDPARRLAQAMGLSELSHDPQRVALETPGELWAMMLDSKRSFDRLVEQLAPDARVREAIFANHYYQQISTALGGSRELVAMERVLEATSSGQHDLLIVDTPPSQHALDFLDAPARLVSLLDGSMTSLLLKPYGLAARAQFRLFQQSSNATLKFLERLTGVQMFADLSEFMLAFSSLFAGFRERSHQVQALMKHPATAFLLICAPEPASLQQVDLFAARLRAEGMQIAGLLANRVHPAPPGERPAPTFTADDRALLATLMTSATEAPLLDRLVEVWADACNQSQADAAALAGLADGNLAVCQVPHFSRDLRGLTDLMAFAAMLGARR